MLKEINGFLSGVPMTMVGGGSLLISLGFTLANVDMTLDPSWAAVVICGIPLLYLALWRLVHNSGIKKISSALLISIAMVAALAIGDIFAAGEVAFIMAIGAILEEKTVQRAQRGLKKLISLCPQQGRRIAKGQEEIVDISQIRVGDILRILPGEVIAVDGEIVRGATSIDQSVITGESLPVDKEVGDSVFSGTLNRFGSIDIKSTGVGKDSSLEKLIQMVKEAEEKKAPMERIADKWASWLVPIALVIALAAYLFTGDIVRGVTVLVVFCPCALVLATPTAIMAAIGQATKEGVIIRSGEALEKMAKVDTIAFDKTGTLTYGTLAVSDIISLSPELSPEDVLTLASSVEVFSEHPLGKAVVNQGVEMEAPLLEVTDFYMEPGKGVTGKIGEDSLICANKKYLEEEGIPLPTAAQAALAALGEQGKATILVAKNSQCIGIIGLGDTIRPTAKALVGDLKAMGINTLLLTGDNAKAAGYFGDKAGITWVKGDLLPQEKVANISKFQEEGKSVCMIGDGVNDAPALKTANVGVAMGSMGSDIAVEAADIALMSDDIGKIPYLKRLANATVNTIRLSIALSLCINFVAIGLSLGGFLTPTTGALVHNAGSVFVVLIAALLYDRKFI